MKTQRYLLRTSFRAYTATTLMVLFGIIVALFCTNVILGFAETYYHNGAGSTMYTVITVAGLDKETQKTDMMTALKKYKPSAALYICRDQDGAAVIGFDGRDAAGLWWPEGPGEFVNSCSSEDYPNVVYLSMAEMSSRELSVGEMFDLDGRAFRIIGYGLMINHNFNMLISKDSPQTVFDRSQSIYPDDDPAGWFRIIPCSVFREAYEPDLIMIHLPELNYGQMLKMTDRLSRMFPNSTVTPPIKSADELFQYALQTMRQFIPLYLVLTEITVILALCELYKKLSRECSVLRICGMSRRKLSWHLIGEVTILYVIGAAAALLLQAALKGFLADLRVERLPTAGEAAAAAGAVFLISIAASLPALQKSLRVQRAGEE